jgi:hypothetical protein
MQVTERAERRVLVIEAGVDGNGHDRKVCPLAGTCANGGRGLVLAETS